MEILIVVVLLALLGVSAKNTVALHQIKQLAVQPSSDAFDPEVYMQQAVGELSADDWRKVTSGDFSPIKKQFEISIKAEPTVDAAEKKSLQDSIAALDKEHQSILKEAARYARNGYPASSQSAFRQADELKRRIDPMRSELRRLR